MFNYTNVKCDVCNDVFTKDSDIVVCPECGTPHHRHCYKELTHCVHSDKHKEKYEWENPNDVKNIAETLDITCPHCKAQNNNDNIVCEKCGFDLSKENLENYPILQDNNVNNPQLNQNPELNANSIPTVSTNFPKSPLDFIQQLNNDLSSEIDGVLVKDIAIYLGSNSYNYIRVFKKMEQNPSYKPFSFIAFLLSGWPFFLYRKLWNLGLFAFIVSTGSSYLLSDSLANPEIIYTDPFLSFVFFGSFILYIIFGFMAYPAIKKKTIQDLKDFKKQAKSVEEYYQIITKKAGPSKLVITLGFVYWIIMLLGIFAL